MWCNATVQLLTSRIIKGGNMNSKEKLVEDIIIADTFGKYSKFMKTCMDIFSIKYDDCHEAAFKGSYGATIAQMGDAVVSDPEQVRNTLVQMLNDELEKSQDIFLTYKLYVAVELLGGTVTCISNSSLCVTDLLSCVDEEKITSSALFLGFAFLKGVDLGK